MRRPPDTAALASELPPRQGEEIQQDPAELEELGEVLGDQFARGAAAS